MSTTAIVTAPVVVITAHPSLGALPAALAAAHLQTLPARSPDELSRLLAETDRRCVAVLDTTRPAPYSFAALYRLLHQPPEIPTLLIVPAQGTPPLASGAMPPLDDFVRLPAQPAEIALRVQALLVRAGLAVVTDPPAHTAPVATEVHSTGDMTAAPPPFVTGHGAATAAAASLARAEGPPFPPGVRFYCGAHLAIGRIDPGRRRLSDHLNDAAHDHVELTDAHWCDLLADMPSFSPAGTVTLRKDQIDLVIPGSDPLPWSSARVPTQAVPVDLALPLFRLTGSLHRRAGDSPSLLVWFTGPGRQFLPVSAATVCFLPGGRYDDRRPIVLVNVRRLIGWWSPSV